MPHPADTTDEQLELLEPLWARRRSLVASTARALVGPWTRAWTQFRRSRSGTWERVLATAHDEARRGEQQSRVTNLLCEKCATKGVTCSKDGCKSAAIGETSAYSFDNWCSFHRQQSQEEFKAKVRAEKAKPWFVAAALVAGFGLAVDTARKLRLIAGDVDWKPPSSDRTRDVNAQAPKARRSPDSRQRRSAQRLPLAQ